MQFSGIENRVPVTIISGFLGSGKTTFLNKVLHGEHGLRVAVLVNDFGEINIDSELLVDFEEDTIQLSNGCICCNISGDLLKQIELLLTKEEKPEYILIETSGVSDPSAIVQTLSLPVVQALMYIDSIVTIVDAEKILTLEGLDTDVAVNQIRSAGIIVLNKVDLISDGEIPVITEMLNDISPGVRVLETRYCDISLEIVAGVGSLAPKVETEEQLKAIHVHSATEAVNHDHGSVYYTYTYETVEPFYLRSFYRALRDLPNAIYRAKGFLFLKEFPKNRGILHIVGKRADVTKGKAWNGEIPNTKIVLIGTKEGVNPDFLNDLFERSKKPFE